MTDTFYRQPMKKVGLSMFFASIPGLAQRARKVPSSAVEPGDGADLLVNCPCGGHPVAEDEQLGECPGGCGRWYVASKLDAFVVYGAIEPPQTADSCRTLQAAVPAPD